VTCSAACCRSAQYHRERRKIALAMLTTAASSGSMPSAPPSTSPSTPPRTCVLEDDEGGIPAQLQGHFLYGIGGAGHQHLAHPGGARERQFPDLLRATERVRTGGGLVETSFPLAISVARSQQDSAFRTFISPPFLDLMQAYAKYHPLPYPPIQIHIHIPDRSSPARRQWTWRRRRPCSGRHGGSPRGPPAPPAPRPSWASARSASAPPAAFWIGRRSAAR
jgi:hypothetical protein